MKNKIGENTTYVLITAARNEESYIEKTIQSVISQTMLPEKWVIVSDGSTDSTDEIVKHYEVKYDFIELLHRETGTNRDFGSKVYAISSGVSRLFDIAYDFIGNLDADISFEPDYYGKVIEKFKSNPILGIAGGAIFDKYKKGFQKQFASSGSVGGPIQMFRRQCFEDIGGFIPLIMGGEDAVAEAMARMHGWEVKSFSDNKVLHHRLTGTAKGDILIARFRQGIMEYSNGYHPIFEIVRCVARIIEKPYLFGSLFRISGYLFAALKRDQRVVPDNVVKFLRREQIQRLCNLIKIK